MDRRQARTGDTMLFKSREMTGWTQTQPWVAGGKMCKDDRKQNTFVPLVCTDRFGFGKELLIVSYFFGGNSDVLLGTNFFFLQSTQKTFRHVLVFCVVKFANYLFS
jgi:hypothetical protein